jgi:hypothetical protein
MQVIAEEPWDWFLFRDEDGLYLDVLVENSFVSFSVAAALTSEQAAGFERSGAAYLNGISHEMRTKALRREWILQPLPGDWAERSLTAVNDWRRVHKA